MLRTHAVGEGVIELRILEAALVGRGGEGEEGLLASGETRPRQGIAQSGANVYPGPRILRAAFGGESNV